MKTILENFFRKVLITEKCWDWQGAKHTAGYGRFKLKTKMVPAHHFPLLLSGIKIPKDLVVDHICRRVSCVKPSHLRIVTRGTNVLENSTSLAAENLKKKICKRGHEFSIENTYWYHDKKRRKNPARKCKKCGRAAALSRYYGRKGAGK